MRDGKDEDYTYIYTYKKKRRKEKKRTTKKNMKRTMKRNKKKDIEQKKSSAKEQKNMLKDQKKKKYHMYYWEHFIYHHINNHGSFNKDNIDFQVSTTFLSTTLIYIMDYAHYLALYYFITEGSYPRDMNDNKLKRRIRNKAIRYLPYRGKLFIKNKDGSFGQEVLHSGNVMDVIEKVHKEGHLGINNTWRRMRLQYEGYQLYDRVREYVESCEQCQLRARRRHIRHEEAHPIPTPTRPFYMIGCDAVGPINPRSKNGNRYLLVAVDYLTRWPVVAAVPNISEQTTAAFSFNCIVKDFGVPSYILTDRGANFKSDYVHTFLRWMGCKPLTTTAFRPQ